MSPLAVLRLDARVRDRRVYGGGGTGTRGYLEPAGSERIHVSLG